MRNGQEVRLVGAEDVIGKIVGHQDQGRGGHGRTFRVRGEYLQEGRIVSFDSWYFRQELKIK